jgi:hypothetical protein
MSGLEVIGAISALASTAVGVFGTITAGNEQKAQYEYQAKVAEQKADEARAASQRDAISKRREGDIIQSRMRSVAAAQGGLSDPSVIDAFGDVESEVSFAREQDIYAGEQQGRGYEDAAAMARFNAKNAVKAAKIGAAGELFKGATSMYDRFGASQQRKGGGLSYG